MAKISTLIDNFNDNTLTGYTTLGYGGGAVAETGGRLSISAVNAAASETEVRTSTTYDLSESAVYLEVPQILTAKTSSETQIQVRLDANNAVGILVANTTFQAFRQVAGSTTFHGQTTYNASTHRWWRFRHTGTTLYWEFSADGVTWTLLHSAAPGFTITAVSFAMMAGTWQAETGAGTALFDNLNTAALTAVGQDVAAAFKVRAAVSQTRPASWQVRASRGQQTASNFNVRAAVGKQAASSFNVATSAAATSAIGQQAAAAWRVRAAIGKQAASAWNTLALVAPPEYLPGGVGVRFRVTSAARLFVVDAPVIAIVPVPAWVPDAGTTVVGVQAAAIWRTRLLVTRSATAAWQVSSTRTAIGKEVVATFRLRAAVARSLASTFAVRATAAQQRASVFKVQAGTAIGREWAAAFRVRRAVGTQVDAQFKVLPAATGFIASGTRYGWDGGTTQGWGVEEVYGGGAATLGVSTTTPDGSAGSLRVLITGLATGDSYNQIDLTDNAQRLGGALAGGATRVSVRRVAGTGDWYGRSWWRDNTNGAYENRYGPFVLLPLATWVDLLYTAFPAPNATNVYAYGVELSVPNNTTTTAEILLDRYQQGSFS